MRNFYYITPDCCIARIGKVGSSSVACAVVKAYYPDVYNALGVEQRTRDATWWHRLAPTTGEPQKPVVMLVREPVDRFRSAMAQLKLTNADTTLERLAGDLAEDFHFQSQHSFVRPGTKCFAFPQQIQAFCSAAGLAGLPVFHATSIVKPILTVEQAAAVRAHYVDDVLLWNSLGAV